ncbi:sugar ABC transporter ATP-binding protein [Rhodopila sp.]|uniref:sugar ABC transporter ATP-binding protein n=1 Tax=Rhodopila sp. TaxID=2480087 RepID=UPI003D0A212F
MTAPALAFSGLSKTFGGQQALRSVNFAVAPGEVHGLLGQNGSGKSTLIKILAGFHAPDPGATLSIAGQDVPLPLPPGGVRAFGVAFVHQHLGLIPPVTVLENLLLTRLSGRGGLRRRWAINWPRERAAARRLFERYELDIDPAVTLSRLSSVERALVAIVRAVEETAAGHARSGHGVLVLDEPTPFLPRADVDRLFTLIRRVVANGASVIFVSHDIEEVLEITDRATVLRDGQVAGVLATADATRDTLVGMIIGRQLKAGPSRAVAIGSGPAAVAIANLSGGQVAEMSLSLRAGEIVGLTGLLGSGYEQVPYLVYGALQARAGTLTLGAERIDLTALTPAAAIAAGLVLIPGDRPVAGGVGALPIVDNVTLPALVSRFRPFLLRRGAMVTASRLLGEHFGVVPNRPMLPLASLSGGNQQKVVLAKWLQLTPKLILLDEPTQGVDVGARQTVYQAIRDAAATGACVLCASSDAEQLAEICDRVVVLGRGRIAAELTPPTLSKHAITECCYGLAA